MLYALLFSGLLRSKKVKPKYTLKQFKRETGLVISFFTELADLLNLIVNILIKTVKTLYKITFKHKKVKNEVVEVENYKVIDLAEFRQKKAK